MIKNFSSGINKLAEMFQGFKEDFNDFKNDFKDLREEVKIIKRKTLKARNFLNTILNASDKIMEKFDAMTKSQVILVGATKKIRDRKENSRMEEQPKQMENGILELFEKH